MADFVLNELYLDIYLEQTDDWYYGVDENFFSTLNSNTFLNVPGGFTKDCLANNYQVSSITRYYLNKAKKILF